MVYFNGNYDGHCPTNLYKNAYIFIFVRSALRVKANAIGSYLEMYKKAVKYPVKML